MRADRSEPMNHDGRYRTEHLVNCAAMLYIPHYTPIDRRRRCPGRPRTLPRIRSTAPAARETRGMRSFAQRSGAGPTPGSRICRSYFVSLHQMCVQSTKSGAERACATRARAPDRRRDRSRARRPCRPRCAARVPPPRVGLGHPSPLRRPGASSQLQGCPAAACARWP